VLQRYLYPLSFYVTFIIHTLCNYDHFPDMPRLAGSAPKTPLSFYVTFIIHTLCNYDHFPDMPRLAGSAPKIPLSFYVTFIIHTLCNYDHFPDMPRLAGTFILKKIFLQSVCHSQSRINSSKAWKVCHTTVYIYSSISTL